MGRQFMTPFDEDNAMALGRDERSEPDVKRLVRERGRAYHFSHETIKRYESGEIEFADADGKILKPRYFGAGLHGMNGVLEAP